MWSREEAGNDLMSNRMIISINIFGLLMKNMVIRYEDHNLVVIEHRLRTQIRKPTSIRIEDTSSFCHGLVLGH